MTEPATSSDEGTKEPDDLLTTFRERYEDAYEHGRENAEEAQYDLLFSEGKNHWDEEIRRQREADGRPCLTEVRIPQFVNQITGKMRQMRPSIKCVPVDSRGDPKTAKILAGLFRYIENRSRAQVIYGRGADSQVTCGIGAWRVTTEYSDAQTFEQEIRIGPVDDPTMVLFDPDAVLPSRSDAMFCFVPIDMTRRKFERLYPGKTAGMDDPGLAGCWTSWARDDYVRTCEYWYKEATKRRLVLLPDGSVEDLTDKDPDEVLQIERMVAEAQAMGDPVRIEERESHKVMRALMSYHDILEAPKEWKGRYIPIIPVVGVETRVGREVIRRGVVRLARDTQRMLNYYLSADTEIVALQPKSPFIGTEKNFERHQGVWDTANTANYPFLPYTPDPNNGGAPPQRSQPPVSSQGLSDGIQRSIEGMKAVIGIYDASLGQRSNETSGVAIEARETQGDTGSFIYTANFSEAISHTAQIIIDLIPHVYDTARTIRIVGEDDMTVEPQKINQPAGLDEDGVTPLMHDVTTGAYDVVVKMGPAYDTLRSEAREGMTAMIQAAPDIFPVVGDLIAKMQDWPHSEDLAERLALVAPPAVQALLAKKRDEPPPPPQPSPQEQELQAKMQLEQAKMQADQQAKQAELQMREQEIVAEMQGQQAKAAMEMQLKREDAALKRELALMDMQLKREQFQFESELKREQAEFDARLKSATAATAAQQRSEEFAARAKEQPRD